jgi:hypothetical protein
MAKVLPTEACGAILRMTAIDVAATIIAWTVMANQSPANPPVRLKIGLRNNP